MGLLGDTKTQHRHHRRAAHPAPNRVRQGGPPPKQRGKTRGAPGAASGGEAWRGGHQRAAALQAGDVLAFLAEGPTGDGSTVLPFHSNLCQAALVAQAPVQPLGLAFADAASGAPSFAPCYVGEDTLLDSVWRTVCAPPLVAVLRFGVAQQAHGRERRQFAADLPDAGIDLPGPRPRD